MTKIIAGLQESRLQEKRNESTGGKLRLIIYRPHTSVWFKASVHQLLRGKRFPQKYGALFDYLLKTDVSLSVSTTLVARSGWKGLLKFVIDPFALLFWIWRNKLPVRRIGVVYRKKQVSAHDVLFFMHYGNFSYETAEEAGRGLELATEMNKVKIFKVGHMTHYAYQPKLGSQNLAQLKPDLLVAESNLLAHSQFYKQYFGKLGVEFQTLPFVAADRFQSTTPFDNRENKLLATGTITYKLSDPDFVNFFGTNELQPLRRKIYDNQAAYSEQIECLISDLDATRRKTSATGTRIERLLKALQSNRQHPQVSYYGRNIVEAYNSFKMFTVTEEICDLPAAGFVEGMACGAAFFGVDSPFYRDLGLIPEEHYVPYDGTLEGLITQVKRYQDVRNHASLRRIANKGCELVNTTLRPDIVYATFISSLRERIRRSISH